MFYTQVMGQKLLETSPYALVFDEGGTTLRVQIVPDLQAASHTVHGWQVTDIRADIAHLAAQGVTFLSFPHLEQDDMRIWTTPDGHKIAWFKDPCGNILSLTEYG